MQQYFRRYVGKVELFFTTLFQKHEHRKNNCNYNETFLRLLPSNIGELVQLKQA